MDTITGVRFEIEIMSDDFQNLSKTFLDRQKMSQKLRKSFEAVLITEQHVFRARYCSILMIYYTDISPLAHRHATDMLATVDPKVAMDTSAECRPTVYV